MATAPHSPNLPAASGFPLSPEVRRAAILTISLVVLCQSAQGLVQGGLALFLPRIRPELDLTFTQGGSLSSVSTLVYAFMQIPAGYLVDRFGPRRLFFIGALGTSVLACSFALIHSYPLLLVNQGAAGFFRSLLFAPGLVLMASWFPPNRRATAMGLFVAGGFTSNIVLNLIGPTLEAWFGWRVTFLIFAALGIAAALAYGRLAKERPRSPGRAASMREALSLFRYRVMWVLGGMQFVRFFVALGVGFWLPSLLVADKGFSLHTTGQLIALSAALTVPSNFLGGYISDRLHNPLGVIAFSMAALAASSVLIVLAPSTVMLIAAMCVNAVFVQFYFGPLFAVPIDLLGARRAGISSGFSNLFANLGGFASTVGLGAVKDATGSFAAGFFAIAACCMIGIGFTAYLAMIQRHWTPPED
ncbi:MAG: MFS transporter [Dehalococcoidia bacterium]